MEDGSFAGVREEVVEESKKAGVQRAELPIFHLNKNAPISREGN